MRSMALALLILVLFSCENTHKKKSIPPLNPQTIISKPILFDSIREALSTAYIKEHYGVNVSTATIDPKIIVVHHTVIPTFEKTFEAFYESTLPASRTKIASASSLNVSSHFGVDRDGTIYRFLPDTTFARHVIGLNHCAIGIENVGGPMQPLTDKQLEANIALIKYLAAKYPIEYVIGHHEYAAFKETKHPFWKELDDGYLTEKNDPGDAFMDKLRAGFSNPKLLGPPQ